MCVDPVLGAQAHAHCLTLHCTMYACRAMASSHPPHHTAVHHYICRAAASSRPPHHTALHCVWRAVASSHHCVTLHCTMWVTVWDVQSCESAQCSIILRLHQVLASCIFFFFAPLCQFCLKYMEVKGFVERDRRVMVCLWGGKHG